MKETTGKIAAALFLAGLLAVAAGAAWAGEAGTVLAGSGIRYPGGYDPNTVGELKGKAYGMTRPEDGPVRFRLEAGEERYTVLLSTAAYWKEIGGEIPDGAEILVRGSKTLGRDRNLYVVAERIRVAGSGKSFALRDASGAPLWKDSGKGAAGPNDGANGRGGLMGGGFGGSGGAGGMGGFMGGNGGMGMGGHRR